MHPSTHYNRLGQVTIVKQDFDDLIHTRVVLKRGWPNSKALICVGSAEQPPSPNEHFLAIQARGDA